MVERDTYIRPTHKGILGENNGRRLLKSVQNPEVLINNMSANMSDYFINTV